MLNIIYDYWILISETKHQTNYTHSLFIIFQLLAGETVSLRNAGDEINDLLNSQMLILEIIGKLTFTCNLLRASMSCFLREWPVGDNK